MARPLAEVDADVVFKLAKIGCTQEEIGEFFGCDGSTISRRFSKEFYLGRAACKTSLRRWQMKRAHAGSDPMLIHLGKVYLGQSDKLDVTSGGSPVSPTFNIVDNGRNTLLHAVSSNGDNGDSSTT